MKLDKGKYLKVYLPDTRNVVLEERYGCGNLKIGMSVFTYSRPAGNPQERDNPANGTCPGSSSECEAICYAKRIQGVVLDNYRRNAIDKVPPIPVECELLRIHVSGDFDTVRYIKQWINRLTERPDVTAWAYTRSWRVPELLPALERLRALPNMQLFASMDVSIEELPPTGWRRAWIDGDLRAGQPVLMTAHGETVVSEHNFVTADGDRSYLCPEETKRKKDCVSCGYCFEGQKHDVTFLKH